MSSLSNTNIDPGTRHYMLDLISHQLRASLLESGKLSLMLQKEDIVSVIEDAIYHHTLKGKELGIEFHLDYHFRPLVRMDVAYMQEVFTQLFQHVMNQSEENSTIKIGVEVTKKEVKVILKYEAELEENWDLNHEWILERSFSKSMKDTVPMIRKLVEGHRGKLWISKLGDDKWTSYCIELPVVPGSSFSC